LIGVSGSSHDQNATAARGAHRLRPERPRASRPGDDLVDAGSWNRWMQRPLMRPVLVEHGSDCLEIATLESWRHLRGDLPHASKRADNARVAALVCTENRRNRIARNARLA